MLIKTRCENFIKDTGVSTTQFCKRIGLSVSGFNRWKHDDLKLADLTEKRISDYLEKFNY